MKTRFVFSLALSLLASSAQLQAEIIKNDKFIQSNTQHEIKLINHGLASLHERLELINSAQESIDVEYFIYNRDDSGKIITDALIKKAEAGVKVRMLLDGMIGKYSINEFVAQELKSKGIQVKYFNSLGLLKGTKNKFRNHRKNLIIDNKIVLTGGRNVGNEYFDFGNKYSFLDRELVIQGELVSEMVLSFNEVWNSKFSTLAKAPFVPSHANNGENDSVLDEYNANLEKAKRFINDSSNEKYLEYIANVGGSINAKSLQTTCSDLKFVTEKPIADKSVRSNRLINEYLHSKIRNAKESVVMETPYFTFSDQDELVLDEALNNNVKITMLTNGANSTDVKISAAAIERILKKWVKKGILFSLFKGKGPEDYELTDGLNKKAFLGIHAKTYVFDNKDIVIGTYNFDFFSAKYNNELVIECSNAPEEFVTAVESDINKRIEKSHSLTNESQVDELSDKSLLGVFFKLIADSLYDTAVN
jgi:putative cardiolipin synthase